MAENTDPVSEKMKEVGGGVIAFLREIVENVKTNGISGLSKSTGQFSIKSGRKAKNSFEINLVPDIKAEMLKTQKARNLTLFVCMIICGTCGLLLLFFWGVDNTHNVTNNNKTELVKILNDKIEKYPNLTEYLTVQGQLSKVEELGQQKNNISRLFTFLSVLLALDKDKITISELTLDTTQSTISFEAQADAGKEPYIDFRVLEVFKKTAAMTTYDYGNYVDENGKNIPAHCVVDTTKDGTILTEEGSIYGLWYRHEKGCDPSNKDGESDGNQTDQNAEQKDQNENEENKDSTESAIDAYLKSTENGGEPSSIVASTDAEDFKKGQKGETKKPEAQNVPTYQRYKTEPEKIWRTPQFEAWAGDGKMNLDGKISGVAHFESICSKYSGTKVGDVIKWSAQNDCKLLTKEVSVLQSSNARNSNNNLVLKFGAKLNIDPKAFLFANKHVIAIGPAGQNVTDSYVQINTIFEKAATACQANDASCNNNNANAGR